MLKKSIIPIIALALLFAASAYAEPPMAPSRFVILNEYSPAAESQALPFFYAGKFSSDKGDKAVRSLLWFDVKDVKGHVVNAYLELNAKTTISLVTPGLYQIGAFRVSSRWEKPSWNTAPRYDESPIGTAAVAEDKAYKIIGLADAVQSWVDDPSSNYGLLIKGIDESRANLKQFSGISLVVEVEEATECSGNGGICRSECGSAETEADYGCSSGTVCCVKKTAPSTKPTAPADYAKEPRADFNGDGVIDNVDFLLFTDDYRAKKLTADLNGDGKVDSNDINVFTENFGKKVPAKKKIGTGQALVEEIDGKCGYFDNQNLYDLPADADPKGLCSAGTSSSISPTSAGWTWKCLGSGAFAGCAANIIKPSTMQPTGTKKPIYWTKVSTLPASIDFFDLFVFKDKLYVIAGQGESKYKFSGVVYSSSNGIEWNKIGEFYLDAYPLGLYNNRVVVYKNKIWLIGGKTPKNEYLDRVSTVYSSPDGISWNKEKDYPSIYGIESHKAIVFNDPQDNKEKIWVIGGFGYSQVYSFDGNEWRKKSDLPDKIYEHASVVYKDKIWAIGGNKINEGNYEAYSSPNGINWYTHKLDFHSYDGTAVVYNNGEGEKIWLVSSSAQAQPFVDSFDGNGWNSENTNGLQSYLRKTVVFDDGKGKSLWVLNDRGEIFNGRPIQPPTKPADFKITAVTESQIDLIWTPSSGAEKYKIERTTLSNGPWEVILDGNAERWTYAGEAKFRYFDKNLKPSTTYRYRISSYNSAGYSEYSNVVSGTTLALERPRLGDIFIPTFEQGKQAVISATASSQANKVKLQCGLSSGAKDLCESANFVDKDPSCTATFNDAGQKTIYCRIVDDKNAVSEERSGPVYVKAAAAQPPTTDEQCFDRNIGESCIDLCAAKGMRCVYNNQWSDQPCIKGKGAGPLGAVGGINFNTPCYKARSNDQGKCAYWCSNSKSDKILTKETLIEEPKVEGKLIEACYDIHYTPLPGSTDCNRKQEAADEYCKREYGANVLATAYDIKDGAKEKGGTVNMPSGRLCSDCNTYFKSITCAPKSTQPSQPKLSITDISTTPKNPIDGETFTFSIKLKNEYSEKKIVSGDCKITEPAEWSGAQLLVFSTINIESGEERALRNEKPFAPTGKYKGICTANFDNLKVEKPFEFEVVAKGEEVTEIISEPTKVEGQYAFLQCPQGQTIKELDAKYSCSNDPTKFQICPLKTSIGNGGIGYSYAAYYFDSSACGDPCRDNPKTGKLIAKCAVGTAPLDKPEVSDEVGDRGIASIICPPDRKMTNIEAKYFCLNNPQKSVLCPPKKEWIGFISERIKAEYARYFFDNSICDDPCPSEAKRGRLTAKCGSQPTTINAECGTETFCKTGALDWKPEWTKYKCSNDGRDVECPESQPNIPSNCNLYDYNNNGKFDFGDFRIFDGVIKGTRKTSEFSGKIFDIDKNGAINSFDYLGLVFFNPKCLEEPAAPPKVVLTAGSPKIETGQSVQLIWIITNLLPEHKCNLYKDGSAPEPVNPLDNRLLFLQSTTTYTISCTDSKSNVVAKGEVRIEVVPKTPAPAQIPSPPSELKAKSISPNEVELEWKDNSNNEDGFEIEQALVTASSADVKWVGSKVGKDNTKTNIKGLSPSTVYTFRVRAFNSAGNSAYTGEAVVVTLAVTQPPSQGASEQSSEVLQNQVAVVKCPENKQITALEAKFFCSNDPAKFNMCPISSGSKGRGGIGYSFALYSFDFYNCQSPSSCYETKKGRLTAKCGDLSAPLPSVSYEVNDEAVENDKAILSCPKNSKIILSQAKYFCPNDPRFQLCPLTRNEIFGDGDGEDKELKYLTYSFSNSKCGDPCSGIKKKGILTGKCEILTALSTAAPQIKTFTITPAKIERGDTAMASWSTINADSCRIVYLGSSYSTSLVEDVPTNKENYGPIFGTLTGRRENKFKVELTCTSRFGTDKKEVEIEFILPAKTCQGASPSSTEGANKGLSQYTDLSNLLYWTYQENVENPSNCFWSCKKGYHKDGASCAPDVSLIPAATLAVCKDARYDFNKDGVVNLVDTGDLNSDNVIQDGEKYEIEYKQTPSSWRFSKDGGWWAQDKGRGRGHLNCPAGLYCSGISLSGEERVAFERFAKQCNDLLKSTAQKPATEVCSNPDYDLNGKEGVNVLDAAEIIDVINGIKACPAGKVCDINKDGSTDLNDIKTFLSLISGCGGISKIDYNSDGKLDAADLNILTSIYSFAVEPAKKEDIRNKLTLKLICFSPLYDFSGANKILDSYDLNTFEGIVVNNENIDASKKTRKDWQEDLDKGRITLQDIENTKRKCYSGTFCAGRIPTRDEFNSMSQYFEDCRKLYQNAPFSPLTYESAVSYFKRQDILAANDVNRDGNLDEADLAAVEGKCMAGKACDFDGGGIQNVDGDRWLSIASDINLALGQPSIIAAARPVVIYQSLKLPSRATYIACRDSRFDFNKDGIISNLDSGDQDGNGQVQGGERSASGEQPESSWKYSFDSQTEGTRYRLCPQGLYCSGKTLLGREQLEFENFAKQCKGSALNCLEAAYDFNNDQSIDIIDASMLLNLITASCTKEKCDLNQDDLVDINDVISLLPVAAKCGGISKVDYDSNGRLDQNDINLLRNTATGGSGVTQSKKDIIYLKQRCFNTLYDFIGKSTPSSTTAPDGMVTNEDVYEDGQNFKEGEITSGIIQLRDEVRFSETDVKPKGRNCPRGTFCAGRIPNSIQGIDDVKVMQDILAECNKLYPKYPDTTNANYFNSASVIAANDINRDNRLDESDFALAASACPSGKICDLDGNNFQDGNDVNMLQKIAALAS